MRADVCRVNDAASAALLKSCIIVKCNYVIERLVFKHPHRQLNKADFHHSLDQDLHASGDIQVFDIPSGFFVARLVDFFASACFSKSVGHFANECVRWNGVYRANLKWMQQTHGF